MYKIFAKPLFLGKKVVHLPECHSTNDEMLKQVREGAPIEGTVICTHHQVKGRGQRGNVWVTEPGKNITCSILLRPHFLEINNQFYLNLIAGLSVIDLLGDLQVKDAKLKWPNDVFVEDKKIAGILIECGIKSSKMDYAVVGLGINVNQAAFYVPSATSLYTVTSKVYSLDSLTETVLTYLEKWYLRLKEGKQKSIMEAYYEVLMWRGELRTFRETETGNLFQGTIIGLDENGRLVVSVQDMLRHYAHKQLVFQG